MKFLDLLTVLSLLFLASCSGMEDAGHAIDQLNYNSNLSGIAAEMAVTGDRYNGIVENPFCKGS